MRFNKLDGGVVYNSVGLDNNEAAPIVPLSTLCASHVSTLTQFSWDASNNINLLINEAKP